MMDMKNENVKNSNYLMCLCEIKKDKIVHFNPKKKRKKLHFPFLC